MLKALKTDTDVGISGRSIVENSTDRLLIHDFGTTFLIKVNENFFVFVPQSLC